VKFTHWLPCAFWLVFGCLMYIVLYGILGFNGVPSTSFEDGKTPLPLRDQGPAAMYIMTAFVAIAYGGLFTINTAYMKKVVVQEQLGLVLGGSLVVLAIGSFVFGKKLCSVHGHTEVEGDQVSTQFRTNFFIWGMVMNILALGPAAVCWMSQVKQLQAEKKKADEEDDN